MTGAGAPIVRNGQVYLQSSRVFTTEPVLLDEAADAARTIVQRLLPDLTPDPSFGVNGELDISSRFADRFLLDVDDEGRLLVDESGFGGVNEEQIVRYNADGSLDPSFRIVLGAGLNIPDHSCVCGGLHRDSAGRLVFAYTSYGAQDANVIHVVRITP
jgi:hypothetical protein